MSVFTVDLKNLPGELAPLCEAMAGAASTWSRSWLPAGEGGTVAFIADDEASAEAALTGTGAGYTRRWPSGWRTSPALALPRQAAEFLIAEQEFPL